MEPIATPNGSLVTLGSVAEVSVVNGPVQINHSERQRTITILVSPDERMQLEAAMDEAWAKLPADYEWLKDWKYV